jgi:hypothetical protein
MDKKNNFNTQSNMLTVEEHFAIRDLIKTRRNSPFIGMAKLYEDGVLNTDTSKDGWIYNMTVGFGREFGAQSLFKAKHPSSQLTNVSNGYDIWDYKIDSFSLGSSGSAVDSGGNITLLGPNTCDIFTGTPIEYLSSGSFNYKPGIAYPPNLSTKVYSKVIKRITSGSDKGSIEFIKSTDDDFLACNNYYTVVKCTCKKEAGDPSTLPDGESIKIDEAFLFMTHPSTHAINTDYTLPTIPKPFPFAHLCFTPKHIEKESKFTIEWFIIF